MFRRRTKRKTKVKVKPEPPKVETVKRSSSPRLFDQDNPAEKPHGCPNMNVEQNVTVIVNEPDDDMLDKCCGCLGGLFKGAAASGA